MNTRFHYTFMAFKDRDLHHNFFRIIAGADGDTLKRTRGYINCVPELFNL